MSSKNDQIVPKEKTEDDKYLESYQIKVTALVPEFLGVRYYFTSQEKKYLVIFGNTPSGYTVTDGAGVLRWSSEKIPGGGALVELQDTDENIFINVKY